MQQQQQQTLSILFSIRDDSIWRGGGAEEKD